MKVKRSFNTPVVLLYEIAHVADRDVRLILFETTPEREAILPERVLKLERTIPERERRFVLVRSREPERVLTLPERVKRFPEREAILAVLVAVCHERVETCPERVQIVVLSQATVPERVLKFPEREVILAFIPERVPERAFIPERVPERAFCALVSVK